jgi:hypothetical protein
MRHRALDKINPHRARCLRAKLNKLQTCGTQLQGKIRLLLICQAQTRRPNRQRWQITGL